MQVIFIGHLCFAFARETHERHCRHKIVIEGVGFSYLQTERGH